jgi:hypothetical protein
MILTNARMLESVIVLSQVEEKGMLGFAVMRNRQKLTAEVQDYVTKREELLKEFGTDVGNGKFEFEPGKAAAFAEALRPYSELTVDVPVMQVSAEVFCGGNLTSNQMFALAWMVNE